MKKILTLLLSVIILVTVFAACSEQQSVDESSSKKGKNSSVTSKNDDIIEEPDDLIDFESEPESEEDIFDEPIEEDFGYDEPIEDDRTELEIRMENVLAGQDEELNKNAIYNEGSLVKIGNVIRRAEKGEKINILFYGGANTSNNGTDVIDSPYTQLVADWWNTEFEAGCQLYVKGVSALTSVNACMRVEHDVTSFKPDIVILDFAVEDAIYNMAKINAVGYDNLIRRIIQKCPNAAIIGLMLPGAEQDSYTVNIKNCRTFVTAAKYHKEICKYYDVPVIDADTAIWDIMFDLIKVTTKTEMPLMTWEDLSQSNVALNGEAHSILAGMFNYFFDHVRGKLKTIGTKAPATPTYGYQGSNAYMKGTFVPINAMVEGTQKGYSCDLYKYDAKTKKTVNNLAKYGYSYEKDKSNTNGMLPYVRAYEHFVPSKNANAEEKSYEKNSHYISFTIPKIKNTQNASFMIVTPYKSYASSLLTPYSKDYAPITIECYNESETLLYSHTAVAKNAYPQAQLMKKCDTFNIPEGTVKITFKAYAYQGAYLLGLGYFEQ